MKLSLLGMGSMPLTLSPGRNMCNNCNFYISAFAKKLNNVMNESDSVIILK